MNKLETIRAAVDKHFAARDIYITERNKILDHGGTETIVFSRANEAYNAQQHTAMLMLRDLLPLLDATIAWGDMDDGANAFDICKRLMNETRKLREESE